MCDACDGKAVMTRAQEGEPFWYDGGLMTMKARPPQTGGSISVVEVRVPQGKATPLHLHPSSEETIFVLHGDISLHVDGTNHDFTGGATWTILRGTPHAFAVRSPEAHLLVMFTPGGGEEFFIAAGEPAARRELPPEAAPDFGKYRAAAAETGLVLLGPPPFGMAPAEAS
jgi:quercetin dioxygenase-like cupin family protein